MKEVDIVIISNAKDIFLRDTTHIAIDSLYKSEDPEKIKFKVVVVESNKDISYNSYNEDPNKDVKTIYTDMPFGYHRYLNFGRKVGNSEYVVLCNNDLEFMANWATNAINAMNETGVWSAGCCNPNKSLHKKHIEQGHRIIHGHAVSNHITGWCIFQKREIYEHIGDLDETFEFWFSDNDYSQTLIKKGFYNILVVNSHVLHHDGTLGETSKREKDIKKRDEMTNGGQIIYANKWMNKKS